MESVRINRNAIAFAMSSKDNRNYIKIKDAYSQGAIDQIAFIQTEITKLKLDTPTTRGIAYNEALIDMLKILAV